MMDSTKPYKLWFNVETEHSESVSKHFYKVNFKQPFEAHTQNLFHLFLYYCAIGYQIKSFHKVFPLKVFHYVHIESYSKSLVSVVLSNGASVVRAMVIATGSDDGGGRV